MKNKTLCKKVTAGGTNRRTDKTCTSGENNLAAARIGETGGTNHRNDKISTSGENNLAAARIGETGGTNRRTDKISTSGENNLAAARIGETVVIKEICKAEIKRRFLDLGLVSGTKVTAIFKSPCGDPVAYLIRGAVIALRREDSKNIITLPRPKEMRRSGQSKILKSQQYKNSPL